MQSKSATKKKTSKAAETIPAVSAELTATSAAGQRPSKSSQPKNDSPETSSAKRHRPSKTVAPAPVDVPVERSPEPIEASPITVEVAPVSAPASSEPMATAAALVGASFIGDEAIRELAYKFWMERGQPHGSHHEDWLRAEKTLAARA